METKRIAIVTGANRGIGFEICRQLAQAGLQVILTARDAEKGKEAAQLLQQDGLDVTFLQLEVGNEESTQQFAAQVASLHNRIDVLVNNAGILPNGKSIFGAELKELKETFDTNFFGVVMLVQALLPLLKNSAVGRIINISSGMGAFAEMSGTHLAYRTSKTALNSLTKILSYDLAKLNIKVNSMCPGWVRTGMGGKGAPRSVQQGADTALWLATAPNITTGGFYRNRREINW